MYEPGHQISFGRYRIDAARREAWSNGTPLKLGGRAFDVLMALLERRDRLVGKHELMNVVWPGLVVEENNLQVQIWALRKALGPSVIATVPGRGYRFTAPITGSPDPAAEPSRALDAVAPAAGEPPGNLPINPMHLYGRDDDLEAVRGLHRQHRLVTIVGAGGIGKSRLALALGHQLRANHLDGVWLVELAPLTDPARLPGAVAQALGLQLRSQRAPTDELLASLGSQRCLLLLDNCEHLIAAASAFVHALLLGAPGVSLLVTSQEPLRLPAERLFRLGPLSVPAAGADDASQAIGHGAVRLFVERLVEQKPRFALNRENAAAVVDICRRLDGLPLAIEFAAARAASFGVQGVRERLGERLRLLTAGSRIALRRHQTLRAALDWSYTLLSEDEQAVFRKLGVFSGGFTIEAAQQVAADEQLDEWTVLDIVANLVDKSLVVVEGVDRPRYRLLESARAYALEKLAAANETDAAQARLAQWMARTFERWSDDLTTGAIHEDGFIAARLLESDNLRAALQWALGAGGNVLIAIELLAHSGPLPAALPVSENEGRQWLDALVQRSAGVELTPRQRALCAFARTMWEYHQHLGVHASGITVTAEELQLLDPHRRVQALIGLVLHSAARGRLDEAESTLREMDDLVVGFDAAAGWHPTLAYVLLTRIRIDRLKGKFVSRRDELLSALAGLESSGRGSTRAAFAMRTVLAEECLMLDDSEAAVPLLEDLVQQGRRQRRDAYRMAIVLGLLVLALVEAGRLDQARESAREGLTHWQRFSVWIHVIPTIALVEARSGQTKAAALLLGYADSALARIDSKRSMLDRRTVDRALEALRQSMPPEELDRSIAEGSRMTEDEAVRLLLDRY